MLLNQQSNIQGLKNVCCGLTISFSIERGKLHPDSEYWTRTLVRTVSTVGTPSRSSVCVWQLVQFCELILMRQIASIVYSTESEISLHFVSKLLQSNGSDCGLFAVASATALAFGKKPELYYYVQEDTRNHLFNCILQQEMSMFPFKKSAGVWNWKMWKWWQSAINADFLSMGRWLDSLK